MLENTISQHERRNPDQSDRRTRNQLSGHLQLLAEMSSHLASSNSNVTDTIERALVLIAHYVNAQAGSLFILEDDASRLTCKASVGPIDITGIKIDADQGIIGHCVTTGQGKIVRDVSQDPDFITEVDEESGFKTESILCAPLVTHDEKIGAIELVNRREKDTRFTESDLLMLQTLASATSMAIANTRMAERLMEQQRVQQEIDMAAEIQRSLLPVADDKLPIFGINIPARTISGDFYDYFVLDDGRIYFSLGDVSGKGMNAALLMAKTASLFRCLGKNIHQPGKLLAKINVEICETATRGMFVTMLCGTYDPATGRTILANAGHEPALFLNQAMQYTSIEASAPPLGIVPPLTQDETIAEQEIMLDGGCLYIFSDGVTEGRIDTSTRLGIDRLKQELIDQQHVSNREQIAHVCSLLQQSNTELHDDITIMSLKDER
ncbi:MAG: SpoIIE family protein phosphatase [Gammaproteobacteria bacterium]|nr:SpoIIE family protein phosphatase [Gammaproteobacteria bacterium]